VSPLYIAMPQVEGQTIRCQIGPRLTTSAEGVLRQIVCGATCVYVCGADSVLNVCTEFLKKSRDATLRKSKKSRYTVGPRTMKCALPHLPYNAAVFGDQPKFGHLKPASFCRSGFV
jgi:hypothetical protein